MDCKLTLRLHKPSDGLKGIVKQYVLIESLEGQDKLWILPNLGNYLLFNPGIKGVLQEYDSDKVTHTIPKEFCIGVKSTQIVRLIVQEKDNTRFPMYGIELHPTGFHRLFGKDSYTLQEGHKLLKEYLEGKETLFNDLYSLNSVEAQVQYLEKGLLRLKNDTSKTEHLVNKIDEIIYYIIENITNVNINDILETFSYSRTSLGRDFKKVVGYSPKDFIQTMRFYMLSKELIGNGYDYKTLAYAFSDQSHMNKAFKKFVDITPSKFQTYLKDNEIKVH